MQPELSVFERQMTELDAEIDARIQQHRTREVTLQATDAAGNPAANVTVTVEQTSSDFLFGANIFMLGGYASAEMNQRYEQAYLGLFNAATVPLYWKGLEPVQGQPRYCADSVPVFRRPPPDVVVDFCQRHQLNMNGHCLVWDNVRHAVPDWLTDSAHSEALLEGRIRALAERYGQRIQRWDVVNEPLNRPFNPTSPSHCAFPADYERLCFGWADQYLPSDAHLVLNETTLAAWYDDRRPHFHQLIRQLRKQGARINGIGLQWHLFSIEAQQRLLDGAHLTPRGMLAALAEFDEHQLPLHVSEITLHSMADDAAGRALQARLVRHVYRLWFSHPSVYAITWWNVPDGGAVPGEDHLKSGLVDEQLNPKPAYAALEQLIHQEWRTRTRVTTDSRGQAKFRGYLGQYCLRAGGTATNAGLGSDTSTISMKLTE